MYHEEINTMLYTVQLWISIQRKYYNISAIFYLYYISPLNRNEYEYIMKLIFGSTIILESMTMKIGHDKTQTLCDLNENISDMCERLECVSSRICLLWYTSKQANTLFLWKS